MILKIKKINPKLDNPLPKYSTENSSGLDITSASQDDIIIKPSATELIPTNLILEIPPGYEGQVRPRSGLALKNNIGIINSPGTVDADYRGELKILLTNFGQEPFMVKFGDRIAQLVISKVEHVEIKVTEDLNDTKRSSGGFGHTGV
ncbi:MAG: dUTP diphosphatase [Chlorobi bacterium]|nr:dUTP diphosphatase [Chlorobiota bacterium]MCI0715576.1 dUTP diphosphatase [Chlorobiota bacterium]